ncbi:MAG: hypothetical protein FWC89_03560 [Defluviitaleaceae bacterium]|nr:hypothetical protein [Defluviitaleaceae bacterium]
MLGEIKIFFILSSNHVNTEASNGNDLDNTTLYAILQDINPCIAIGNSNHGLA